jgi:alkylated DNA repair protein (DNA oxidative demethylase)
MAVTEIRPLFETLPSDLPAGLLHFPRIVPFEAQKALLGAVSAVGKAAPFTQTRVKGGGMTSAAMTNCGEAGWWSDRQGYRYERYQPGTEEPWPAMPAIFRETVTAIVAATPWPDFVPDACLINFYGADAKMGLHQDKDERDFSQPIVTVSLGDAADFIVGGFARTGPTRSIRVESGDAIVMGGDSRMRFHGVRRIYPGTSPLDGVQGRYSLTFRKAL